MKRISLTLLLVVCVMSEASAKVRFTVVASPFTQQSVLSTDYHPAIPTKTVCEPARTLEIERAKTLADHLEHRLSALSDKPGKRAVELYALSLIAGTLREKCDTIGQRRSRV